MRVRFAGLVISLELSDKLQTPVLPEHFEPAAGGEPAQLRLELRETPLAVEDVDGPVVLRRGSLEGVGNRERLLWRHPKLGVLVEVRAVEGVARIGIRPQNWDPLQNPFDQLLLPAMLPLLALRGLRALHASSVLFDGKGYVIAGASGAGKSSTALMLLSQGAKLVADDLVFSYHDQGRRWIVGLGDGLRTHRAVWRGFAQFGPPPEEEWGGKARRAGVELPVSRRAPLSAILLLDPQLEPGPLSQATSLVKLLELCYHLDNERSEALHWLEQLIRSVSFESVCSAEEAANRVLQAKGAGA